MQGMQGMQAGLKGRGLVLNNDRYFFCQNYPLFPELCGSYFLSANGHVEDTRPRLQLQKAQFSGIDTFDVAFPWLWP